MIFEMHAVPPVFQALNLRIAVIRILVDIDHATLIGAIRAHGLVYLGLAMSMSAVVKGITNQIEPGPATDRDLYSMTDEEFKEAGIRRLPRNLMAATEALREDELAEEVMGPVMRNSYLAYKVDE
ncbi:MAG: glutamine synthetase, partial [Gammaproteobacteria bacterium]|nr:glutamine synthetase [Gammaproteobacteria bacterium]